MPIWTRQILDHLRIPQATPIQVLNNSRSSCALAHNSSCHGRTKHIELHYHFVREFVATQIIRLDYCSTHENVADLFTMPLPRDTIGQLPKHLNLGAPFWC